MTPSNRSGALPTTTASMSSNVSSASASARSTASRRSPAIDTSSRLARWCVWPTPITAASVWLMRLASMVRTRFCCRAGPEVAWARALCDSPGPDALRGLADPVQARGEHRVRGERAARRVDADVAAEPERVPEDQLLVRERCMQLGQVDPVDTGSGSGRLGARGGRQVARGERDRLDPVLEAGDPGRRARDCARRGLVGGGDDHGGGAVADRGAVPAAQRVGVHRLAQHVVDRRLALADRPLVARLRRSSSGRPPRPSPSRPTGRGRDRAEPGGRRSTRRPATAACTVYGSSCSVIVRRRVPAEDLPKP